MLHEAKVPVRPNVCNGWKAATPTICGTPYCQRRCGECGRLIAVEYPMNYLRPLITKWNDGLLGKSFPRRVTAPNGSRRWEAASGRSFTTFEEARKA